MTNGLGWRLENLRDQAEYSQKEISSKLGFSQNTYGQYEREERTPSIDTLIELADLFNVSLDYLLRGKEFKDENAPINNPVIKEVLNTFSEKNSSGPYELGSQKQLYNEYQSSLTKLVAIKDILKVFKKYGINNPYILQAEQWAKLSRDDLISLTKHFEWTVFQADNNK